MGWLVGLGLPKRRAPSRYAHPPPSLQLSNPLPNSPGTPTHLGHPHGQLSLSTLVHQSPQLQQPSASGSSSKVSDSCKSLASSSSVISCTNSARPFNFCIFCIIHGERWRKFSNYPSHQQLHPPTLGWWQNVATRCLVQFRKTARSARDNEANQSN